MKKLLKFDEYLAESAKIEAQINEDHSSNTPWTIGKDYLNFGKVIGSYGGTNEQYTVIFGGGKTHKFSKSGDTWVCESLNEKSSADNALLQKMFKALKKSKNFKSVKMEKPFSPEDWDGAIIKVVSKLKGENEHHKDEFDDFEIGIETDGGIAVHYTPSGNVDDVNSVADIMTMTRANESLNESSANVTKAMKHIRNGVGWAADDYVEEFGGPMGLSSKEQKELAIELAKNGMLYSGDSLKDKHIMDGEDPGDDNIKPMTVAQAKKMVFESKVNEGDPNMIWYIAMETPGDKYVVKSTSKYKNKSHTGSERFKSEKEAIKKAAELNKKKK